MSQFDKSTERKAEEHASANAPEGLVCPTRLYAFTEGRNSAKESLLILARALLRFNPLTERDNWDYNERAKAIAAVKRLGDWPLAEAGEEAHGK